MNLSLGGGKRQLVGVAAAIVLILTLASCSGGSASDDVAPTPAATTTATPDQAALDKAAVTDLVTKYWDVVISAENSANTDRSQFSGVAQGKFLENEFRKLDSYAEQGIKRVGNPSITAIDVVVNGDTATIEHCIDEDQWTAVRGTKPLDPILSGNRPFGLTATRSGDGWIISDTGLSKAQEKAKACS